MDDDGWTLWKRRANDGELVVICQENLTQIIEQMFSNLTENE